VGLNVGAPVDVRVEDERPATFLRAAEQHIKQGETEVVVFLMSNPRKELYDQMKQLCCLKIPIPSQAILARLPPQPPKQHISLHENSWNLVYLM
jgi:hypothetical protein